MRSVIAWLNSSRLTASAAPAGSACLNAVAITRLPRRVSSLLEDAQRAVGQGAAHRVAADQLGQAVGDVRLGAALRAHLVEMNVDAAAGDLPGGFRARQPAADDRDGCGHGCCRRWR
jgi:hypothetical protein